MNRLIIILISALFPLLASAQYVGIKTNVLYDAIAVPNLALEISLGKHFTADIAGSYNPFEGSKSIKHWLAQPELRYWPIERFNGHFIGLHGVYMDYVFRGVKLPFGMNKDHAYNGSSFGGGLSYGYQLYLSPRWNIEFTAGFGYLCFEYDKFIITDKEREYKGLFRSDYWGITKAGITIVYILK